VGVAIRRAPKGTCVVKPAVTLTYHSCTVVAS
jgi:hypothetical protein